MRIISQDGLVDLPYERSFLAISENTNSIRLVSNDYDTLSLGVYETLKDVERVFTRIRDAYSYGNRVFIMPQDNEVV